MAFSLTSVDEVLHPPTDLENNLRYRGTVLNAAAESAEQRSNLLTLSSKDILWTFNAMFWTKDPRKGAMSDQPFTLWPLTSR